MLCQTFAGRFPCEVVEFATLKAVIHKSTYAMAETIMVLLCETEMVDISFVTKNLSELQCVEKEALQCM